MNNNDEKKIIQSFYEKVQHLISQNKHVTQKSLDFQCYKFILSQTDKNPKEYIRIFKFLPDKAKQNILDYLKYKDEKEFRIKFRNALSIYKQQSKRSQEEVEEI